MEQNWTNENRMGNQPPYDGTQQTYGSSQQSYGGAQQNYGTGQQSSYIGAQQGYGAGQQSSYAGAQQGYGTAQQSSYTGAQQGYGTGQQSSYTGAQQNYGTAQQSDSAGQQKPKKAKKQKKPREGKPHFGVTLAKCAAIALVFGLVSGSTFAGVNRLISPSGGSEKQQVSLNKADGGDDGTGTTNVAANVNTTVTDVTQVVENAMPSIVAITNISQVRYNTWFGTDTQEEQSCGSGIIVSEDDSLIYIATNNHVVSGANELTVQFCDDSTVAAEVKGTDAASDLAVVAVRKQELSDDTLKAIKVATLGSSGDLKVGEAAIAIGNALGWGQSVTTGVISALDREVTVADDDGSNPVTNELIQTDAAINPGNSGGALLNTKGEVIGINSVKYGDTYVEGMGYAIPIDTAAPIIEKLINREVVSESRSAYLGISGMDVTQSVAESYDMPQGVLVRSVADGSAAEQAGLEAGDIITSFDGSKITSSQTMNEAMKYCEAGQQVELVFQRLEDGAYQEHTVTVTLGSKN